MSTTGVRVHASFSTKEKDLFLAAIKPLIEATRKEKGCILYELFQQVNDNPEGTKYAMIEHWQSKEHLDEHMKTAHVAEFRKKVEGKGDVEINLFKSCGI